MIPEKSDRTVDFILGLHLHQPAGNFEYILENAYNDAYRPLIVTFSGFDALKLNLHISAPLLEFLKEKHPDFLELISSEIQKGKIEMMGGGFYEPILISIPKRDIEGMYLVLAALIEQADKLVIFQLPELDTRGPVEPAEDWQGRLVQGYEEALLKLSDYIIIRRRDVPIEALMDPQWEGLVRHNLRMLLEQAQVALLSGNQTLFRESLERASH